MKLEEWQGPQGVLLNLCVIYVRIQLINGLLRLVNGLDCLAYKVVTPPHGCRNTTFQHCHFPCLKLQHQLTVLNVATLHLDIAMPTW